MHREFWGKEKLEQNKEKEKKRKREKEKEKRKEKEKGNYKLVRLDKLPR